ncbi:MAG: hypothetical protein ACRD1T_08660, partial [Acidimicrobiia bacterium]
MSSTARSSGKERPHIVLIGEGGLRLRNLCSGLLPVLSKEARITLITLKEEREWLPKLQPSLDRVLQPPQGMRERGVIRTLRKFLHLVHFRWMWNAIARNRWETADELAKSPHAKLTRVLSKVSVRLLANRPTLGILARLERYLTWKLRPGRFY